MSNKKTDKKKSPYPENGKVRIRHSYYTFAREFPSRILPLGGKRRKYRKNRIVKNILLCFLFVSLMLLSYFTVNLFTDISYTEAEKLASSEEAESSVNEGDTSEPALPFGGDSVKALYMPAEKLGDREYISSFIKQIRRKNCNSAVIDFKNSDGRLSYTSLNENAIMARTALFDNDTVRQALDLFEREDIRVIARIYCFRDNAVSTANPDLAVKYMNTDVNWIDAKAENGGQSRLNPLSKDARKYVLNVIEEVLQFKIDGILLEEVSYPSGEYVSSASYPGEKKGQGRNKALLSFLGQAKKLVGDDRILLLGHSANDVLETNSELYFGSMLKSDTDGFSVNTAERPENITVDKKTDYASLFSLFSSLKNNSGEKRTVYTVDKNEYSASLLRKMQKAGYSDFIIYSPEGIY